MELFQIEVVGVPIVNYLKEEKLFKILLSQKI